MAYNITSRCHMPAAAFILWPALSCTVIFLYARLSSAACLSSLYLFFSYERGGRELTSYMYLLPSLHALISSIYGRAPAAGGGRRGGTCALSSLPSLIALLENTAYLLPYLPALPGGGGEERRGRRRKHLLWRRKYMEEGGEEEEEEGRGGGGGHIAPECLYKRIYSLSSCYCLL